MPLLAVFEQMGVARHQRVAELPRRGEEDAVGRVGGRRAPSAIQITAQVSRRKAGMVGYRAASHSSSAGEVKSAPGAIVTVPLSAPKIVGK